MNSDTAWEIVKLFMQGVKDAFCGVYYYYNSRKRMQSKNKNSESSAPQVFSLSKLSSTVVWIFVVNGVLLGCSCFLCDLLVLGTVKMGMLLTELIFPVVTEYVWNGLAPAFKGGFSILWILPVFFISRWLNFLWYQDVADITSRTSGKGAAKTGIVATAADSMCSLCVEVLFYLQSGCLCFIPDIGYILYVLHMSLLCSMYAFDYPWCNLGWCLPKRITLIESNWPYFIGFGLPLAISTSLTSNRVLNLGMFSVLFPVYIIGGNNTKPPTPRHICRIPVFSIAESLTNKIVRKVSSWQ